MAGNKIGGQRAAATNKAKHGEDFYARIGAQGGKAKGRKGFAVKTPCDCKLVPTPHYIAQCAGALGGTRSRRAKKSD